MGWAGLFHPKVGDVGGVNFVNGGVGKYGAKCGSGMNEQFSEGVKRFSEVI